MITFVELFKRSHPFIPSSSASRGNVVKLLQRITHWHPSTFFQGEGTGMRSLQWKFIFHFNKIQFHKVLFSPNKLLLISLKIYL